RRRDSRRRRTRRAGCRQPPRWRPGPRRTCRVPAHTEGGHAPRRRARALTLCGTVALFLRRGVRIGHVGRLELLGIEVDFSTGPAKLFHVRPLDALILNLEHPRLRPLAVRAEPHLANDRAELVRADVIGHLLLVETL